MGEFDYLKRFVSKEESSRPNWFTPLDESAVADAEGRIGFRFPPSLRSFYLEIGSGFLATTSVNRFLTPAEVADLYLGDSELMPSEGFEAGELPVFEVGSDLFLVLAFPATEEPVPEPQPGRPRLAASRVARAPKRTFLSRL